MDCLQLADLGCSIIIVVVSDVVDWRGFVDGGGHQWVLV
jgi:hypothetical protein